MNARLFGIVIVAALLLCGCEKSPAPLPVLRVGHAPHDHHSPLYVAAMNPEYFKEHGGIYLEEIAFRKEYELVNTGYPIARVLIESSTGGKELIRRLSEEQFDMSFGGLPAMLTFIDQGNPLHVLAPTMTEGSGLIVRKDLPASSWAEFLDYVRGREQPLRIGYKIAVSVQSLIFERALRASDIPFGSAQDDTPAKISLVDLHGAKNLIPALENGLIDGFVVMQPYLALAESRQSGKLLALLSKMPPAGRWHGYPCCALAANDAFLQTQPVVAEAFTTLMLRANRFIVERPEKSAGQIARWLDLPPGIEERSLPTSKFTVEFDDAWHSGIDFWINSMVESGKLTGKIKEARQSGLLKTLVYDNQTYDKARRNLE